MIERIQQKFSEDDKPCFLCSIFEDSLKNVRNHINNVRDRENEVDISYGDDEGLDINNSTHTTKVGHLDVDNPVSSVLSGSG